MNGIENLIATIEAMSVRCKPGGRLAELLADLQAQRRQQEGEHEPHPVHKYQVSSFYFLLSILDLEFILIVSCPNVEHCVNSGDHHQR